ncbi:hypothetical protein SY83_19340 [Paenibacillus swuensis]|uniref:Uncharacterized protein n=1 Tax=Paenibacillus swuensis TaxID=1178515 RepID=A0A172TLY8_9BACL|nr:hypothetical protein [Paenibacillus swuensis]ANE48089.1 hypothetical protein SY83_19340 [Paenibacillus swuensis]
MYGKQRIWFYIIIGLMVIGVLTQIASLLLPIIIIGGVLLLYKFPPSSFKNSKGGIGAIFRKNKGPIQMNKAKTKRANPFYVIKGNKKDSEDDPPTYH